MQVSRVMEYFTAYHYWQQLVTTKDKNKS
jgi:hypothetical protein